MSLVVTAKTTSTNPPDHERNAAFENASGIDPYMLLIAESNRACDLLPADYLAFKGIKFYLVLNLAMQKVDLATGDIETTKPYFGSKTVAVIDPLQISNLYEESIMQIFKSCRFSRIQEDPGSTFSPC